MVIIPPASQLRTFGYTFTIAWAVIIALIFIYGTYNQYDEGINFFIPGGTQLNPPCRLEFFGSDQCAFVQNSCTRIDHLGLVPYLKHYYCARREWRVPLLAALLTWLVIIFAAMATAADKFLAVNLASLVHSLKISENLAGVTIFAFGNGSSDLFSTLAAMNSGNGSLAIAELFGAAAFITTMVLGAIAITQPFSVDKKSFLGDVLCFLLAASVNLAIISDGRLALGESFVIIGLYVAFVAFVLIRDRMREDDIGPTHVEESAFLDDTEYIAQEADETTVLIAPPSKISYVSKSADVMSSAASAKTLVVEEIVESSSDRDRVSADNRSEQSSISDWVSEYEHMADIPPFIKLCAAIKSCRPDSVGSLCSSLVRFPAMIAVGLTTITQPEIEHCAPRVERSVANSADQDHDILDAPERHPKEYWLLCAQVVFGPQFLVWLVWSHAGSFSALSLYIACGVFLVLSSIFIIINKTSLLHPGRYLHRCLSITGFLTATAWIYLLAAEAVALIETLGVISNISDALLGATVFAIGNSSDDIFANLSVAKRGHPVLASAACLGGPMLNTLLGIGFGSLIQIVKGHYQPYVFNVPASLFVSAISLLTGLSVILVYVLVRGGRLDKMLGYGLMVLWVSFTAINVYVSMRS